MDSEMNRTALGDAITRWEPGRYAILEDNAIFDTNMATAESTANYERLRESVYERIGAITGVTREALTINVRGENGTNQ